MRRFLLAGVLTALAVAADAETPRWSVVVSPSGAARVDRDDKEFGLLTPALFEVPWQLATMGGGKGGEPPKNGVHRGQIRAASGGVVEVELRKAAEAACVRLEYRLTPRKEMKLNSLNVTLTLPTSLWAGGKFGADGREDALPVMFKSAQLHARPTKSLKIAPPGGGALRLDFAEPAQVLVQDDRQWGETFSVRIESANAPEKWPAGRTMTLAFTLGADGGLRVEEDKPVVITAGSEWLPLDVDLDIEAGSALDFSGVMPRHAPAGKFGRVIATRQGKFAFNKRATPTRFYGVNLCFSAQYLPHELADRLAERLARLGYNAVRIHHYESELVEHGPGGPRLKADKLDQFDYLFAALKRRGLYVTTDLFVSRPVALADIYEGEPGNIGMDEFKMAVHVNDRAFESYKAFARALLGHENSYTKLRYADDPALAWLSLVNEDCPGNFISGLKGRLRDDWQRAWNRWLAARHPGHELLRSGNAPFQNVYAHSPSTTLFNAFLAEVERDFFDRTRRFLRDELRCNALLTDCNAWSNPVQLQAVRDDFDYVDDHFYVDHPEFIERPWQLPSRCANTSPIVVGATGGRGCAFTRVFGKPFTITEFNYSGPGRFRGVGGILTGALGAVQDWDGLWRFAYSHTRDNLARPGAMNYFDLAGDPLNLAAERASLCLFLRGDLQPAKHAVVLDSEPKQLLAQTHTSRDKTPSWHGMAWLTRVGWLFSGDAKAAKNELALPFSGTETNVFASGMATTILDTFRERRWLPTSNRTDFKKNTFQSESGEVTIDPAENILRLDTVRTAGGFAPAGKRIETRAATIEIVETDATVWVSSLDSKPITVSQHLLITHLTDLQNSGTRYGDRNRQILQSWGQLPHLVRAGRATVTLRLKNAASAKVHALAVNGRRLAEVATNAKEGGAISIPLSVAADGKARMLYEVEVGR
jgi:hypothetical protein